MILIFLHLLLCNNLIAKEVTVSSPDGNYQMRVYDRDGFVFYTVHYKHQPVILESALGLSSNWINRSNESQIVSGNRSLSDWYDGLQIDSIAETSVDVVWEPPYGERSTYRDNYNGCAITILKTNNPRRRMQIIVRVSNEGVAFRYHLD